MTRKKHAKPRVPISQARERELLEILAAHAEDTVRFFSNDMQPNQERAACAAFLRCLGIDFKKQEINSYKQDPPDVVFRSARFETLEILDEGRKRHDEWKEKRDRLKQAKSIEEAFEQWNFVGPIPYSRVVSLVTDALSKKSGKYGGPKVCAGLDALVYVNLLKHSLDPETPLPNLSRLINQGWRSVSLLMTPFAHILYANSTAPEFLRKLVCQTRSEWKKYPDELFKI